MEVCEERNPEAVKFNQSMRNHLLSCLDKKFMTQFPTPHKSTQELLPRPASRVLVVKVYCFCKMPAQFDAVMVECDSCKLWYHCKCVDIDPQQVPLLAVSRMLIRTVVECFYITRMCLINDHWIKVIYYILVYVCFLRRS